jgi:hypothetical protein
MLRVLVSAAGPCVVGDPVRAFETSRAGAERSSS